MGRLEKAVHKSYIMQLSTIKPNFTIDEFYLTALILSVYPLALLPYFIGDISISYFTYPYKILLGFLSLLFVLRNKRTKQPAFLWVMICFFTAYLLRMCYDFYYLEISYKRPPENYIITFFFNVIIPVVGVWYTNLKKINFSKVFEALFWGYFIFCLLNMVLFEVPENNVRSQGITPLHPIFFGNAGVTLLSLSLALFLRSKGVYNMWLARAGFFSGFFIVLLSGSKGPLIYAVFITMIALFLDISIFTLLRHPFTIASVVLTVAYLYYVGLVSVFDRVEQSVQVEDASTIQRIDLLSTTLGEIKKHFFFGSSYLIKKESLFAMYPHNLILESFMTMGVFGGLIFLYLNYIAIRNGFNILKNKSYMWIGLLFAQYYFQTFISSSVDQSSFFWILLVLVIKLNTIPVKHENKFLQ